MFQEIIILIEYISKKCCLCVLKQELNTTEVCGCGSDWRMVVRSLDERCICRSIKKERKKYYSLMLLNGASLLLLTNCDRSKKSGPLYPGKL
jgi:hypothetical protein